MGDGSTSVVFRAVDLGTSRVVALKRVALQDDCLPLVAGFDLLPGLTPLSIVDHYAWSFQQPHLIVATESCDLGSLTEAPAKRRGSQCRYSRSSDPAGLRPLSPSHPWQHPGGQSDANTRRAGQTRRVWRHQPTGGWLCERRVKAPIPLWGLT